MPIAAIYDGVVGQATGGAHDRQSDGGIDRVRSEPRISSPDECDFEDEGYSGASLVRPGLERYAILRQKVRSRRCWFMHPTG